MNTWHKRFGCGRESRAAEPLRLLLTGLMTVLAVMTAVEVSADEVAPPPHGRISFDGGGLLIRGLKDQEWARGSLNTLALPGDILWVEEGGASELEFVGGTFLRMADASRVELVDLTPSLRFRGWLGSFYIQRLVGAPGQCLMQTPACTVEVFADSAVRVDITENGAVTVAVRWGSADVRTDHGDSVRVSQGYRVWVDPGLLPSDPAAVDRNQSDAFDRWNTDRAALLANSVKTLPRDVPVVSAIGAAELASHGTWIYIDNRPYWRPVIVDYVPFRYGYWNYVPAVGHVWVGAYPFCYVTEHYGRWRYVTTYGWVWTYDPVWSPAWAVTVSVGDRFLWAPCDFYARPVLVADSAVFSVGSLSFSIASVSWMPDTYITTGYALVYPATPVILETVRAVPTTQVNIWNIYANPSYPQRISRPVYPVDTIRVRDYSPRRSIRGVPQILVTDEVAPSERARVLETRIPRAAFQPVTRDAGAVRGSGQPPRTSPLTAENRNMQPSRSVRLARDLFAASPSGDIDRRVRAQMGKDDFGAPDRTIHSAPAVRNLPESRLNRSSVSAASALAERTESAAAPAFRERAYALRTPQGGGTPASRSESLFQRDVNTAIPTLTNTTPHRPLVNFDRSRAHAAELPSGSIRPVQTDRTAAREFRTGPPEPSTVSDRKDLSVPAKTPVRGPRMSPGESVREFTPRVAVRDMEPASPLLPGRNRSSGGSGSTARPASPPARPPAGSDQPRGSNRDRSAAPAQRSFKLDLPSVSTPVVPREARPDPVSRPTSQPMSGSLRPMSGGFDTVGRRDNAPVRDPSFSPRVSRSLSGLNMPRAEKPAGLSPAVGGISRPSAPVSSVPSRTFSPQVAPVKTPAAPSVRGGAPGGFTRMR